MNDDLVEFITTTLKVNRNMRQKIDPESRATVGYCQAVADVMWAIEKFNSIREGNQRLAPQQNRQKVEG
jgi:hypothetical protein